MTATPRADADDDAAPCAMDTAPNLTGDTYRLALAVDTQGDPLALGGSQVRGILYPCKADRDALRPILANHGGDMGVVVEVPGPVAMALRAWDTGEDNPGPMATPSGPREAAYLLRDSLACRGEAVDTFGLPSE